MGCCRIAESLLGVSEGYLWTMALEGRGTIAWRCATLCCKSFRRARRARPASKGGGSRTSEVHARHDERAAGVAMREQRFCIFVNFHLCPPALVLMMGGRYCLQALYIPLRLYRSKALCVFVFHLLFGSNLCISSSSSLLCSLL